MSISVLLAYQCPKSEVSVKAYKSFLYKVKPRAVWVNPFNYEECTQEDTPSLLIPSDFHYGVTLLDKNLIPWRRTFLRRFTLRGRYIESREAVFNVKRWEVEYTAPLCTVDEFILKTANFAELYNNLEFKPGELILWCTSPEAVEKAIKLYKGYSANSTNWLDNPTPLFSAISHQRFDIANVVIEHIEKWDDIYFWDRGVYELPITQCGASFIKKAFQKPERHTALLYYLSKVGHNTHYTFLQEIIEGAGVQSKTILSFLQRRYDPNLSFHKILMDTSIRLSSSEKEHTC